MRLEVPDARGRYESEGPEHSMRSSSARLVVATLSLLSMCSTLTARGETPAAFGAPNAAAALGTPFGRRSSPLHPTALENARRGPRADCVAPPSFPIFSVVTPFARGPHGADFAPWGGAGRLAALGATPDFHHGLLTAA